MDKDMDLLLKDSLLIDCLLDVPDNFTHLVMQRIYSAPVAPSRLSWQDKLQNLALIIGGVLGFTQLATFMFGIWIATSAG